MAKAKKEIENAAVEANSQENKVEKPEVEQPKAEKKSKSTALKMNNKSFSGDVVYFVNAANKVATIPAVEYTVSSTLKNIFHVQSYILEGYDEISGQKVERIVDKFIRFIDCGFFSRAIKNSPFGSISYYDEKRNAFENLIVHINETYAEASKYSFARKSEVIVFALAAYFSRNFDKLIDYQKSLLPSNFSELPKPAQNKVLETIRKSMFRFKYGDQLFELSDIVYHPFDFDISSDDDCLDVIPEDLKSSLGI